MEKVQDSSEPGEDRAPSPNGTPAPLEGIAPLTGRNYPGPSLLSLFTTAVEDEFWVMGQSARF